MNELVRRQPHQHAHHHNQHQHHSERSTKKSIGGSRFIVLDQDLMVSTTPAAKAAFEAVLNVYCAYRDKHVLKPGDLLLVDNNRTVHGRSPFRPRYDGSDRFVIRAFITNDLTKSRYARPGNGRTIDARYS